MITRQTPSRLVTVIFLATVVLAVGQSWAGDSRWYAAARLGESSVEALLGDRHPKLIDDRTGTAAIEVGYAINRNLAVEFGYQDLGEHAGFGSPCRQTDDGCIERLASLGLCVEGSDCTEVLSDLEAKIDAFSLALVPSWPLTDRLSLRGKVGLVAWDAEVGVERGFLLTSGSRVTRVGELFSSRDLLAGAGLHYGLPSGLGILLQYEAFDLDAESTSLGVSWRF